MSQDAWGATAATILRTEMAKRRMTYAELVAALSKSGVDEVEKNLRNKVMRGTFSAGFFLLCLKVLGVDTLRLNEWDKYPHVDADGRRYRLASLRSPPSSDRPTLTYEFMGFTRQWSIDERRMNQLKEDGRIVQTRPDAEPRRKLYQDEAVLTDHLEEGMGNRPIPKA